MPSAAVDRTLQLVALLLAGCAATVATDDGRRVTIEHGAALAADEVVARAMRACQQAGKANAAFETMDNKRPGLGPGTGVQTSTFRCTP